MTEKRYLVALPIASLDRLGRALPQSALVLGFASDSFLVEDTA